MVTPTQACPEDEMTRSLPGGQVVAYDVTHPGLGVLVCQMRIRKGLWVGIWNRLSYSDGWAGSQFLLLEMVDRVTSFS